MRRTSFGRRSILSRKNSAMAPSRVTRYLGLFWLLVPLLGCADDVELLSTRPSGLPTDGLRSPTGVAGTLGSGGAEGERGGTPSALGGRAGELAGATSASGGVAATSGDGGDPNAAGDTSSGGGPAAASGGYAGGGVAGSCGGGCGACRDDVDCAYGSEWCVSGACSSCTAAPEPCAPGWVHMAFQRHGCLGFECVPPSACHTAADCGGGAVCYAGALCPEDCAAGDPSCCFGNVCARSGCDGATVPLTCSQRGCPLGRTCAGPDWTAPDCNCDGSTWSCVTRQSPSECI
jgi:hypothetical protein